MARKKNYALQDCVDLLNASEGRASPKSGEPGHTIHQHVGGREEQVGGRLTPKLTSSASAPIIIDPSGQVASKKDHQEIYVSAGLATSKTKAGGAFDTMFEAGKKAAGTFLDLQQAYSVLQYALNSADGQAALGKLDGGSAREFFSTPVTGWTMARSNSHKMYTASLGPGGSDMSDMTHLADFSSVTVGIDRMAIADGVHLQTLYPCA